MATVRGQFKQRVTFLDTSKSIDDEGGHGETFPTLFTTWARVKSKSVHQALDAGYAANIDRKLIEVLWRSVLAGKDTRDLRIVYQGKDYSIDGSTLIDEEKKVIRYEVTGLS